ncbi:hypothetical protein G7085_08920 [Tessaracoccus sp. HDW20]|uniref:hypothetical protein n=1 Tax=Tessaracoccus coleopterorum TaxID=2714950 RepID=UPI0018D439F0|nr:hypothetical protein [Tessaracoccus coleopterorum]NHB84690.1 hypothetical protein [Tessaracoccus coleopterorum]
MSTNGYGRTAWIVWGVGILAYAIVVMHRTALGVAGLEAAEHFNTTPASSRPSWCCNWPPTPSPRYPSGCCSTGSAPAPSSPEARSWSGSGR